MCLGIPGKIISIYSQDGLSMAKVDFGGVVKEICLTYTPQAQIGDYALVHVGFAISLIDEEEAQRTYALLEEIISVEEELGLS